MIRLLRGRAAGAICAGALCVWAGAAVTQDQTARDRDWLTALIEDNLSGAGRQVQLDGFRGALSSRASFDKLTIADAEGVWLEIDGAVLDWTRSALLSGRLEVNELTAERIVVARIPASDAPADPTASLPHLTAQDIKLPELPVSVNIGKIGTPDLELGAGVLGQAVSAKFDGTAQLGGSSGSMRFDLARTDGQAGQVLIAGSLDNATRMLEIDLSAQESAGGIVATALDLPGQPPVDFSFQGKGPLSDFTADLTLATDGQPRLAGALRLMDAADGAQGFALDVSGDLSPLLKDEYRDFFGTDTTLAVAGTLPADGGSDISKLAVSTSEMTLTGALRVAADGLPEAFRLDGTIRPAAGGGGVLLPVSGTPLTIGSARVRAAFDAAQGQGWTLDLGFSGLSRGDLRIGSGQVSGKGTIARSGSGVGSVTATIETALSGLVTGDAAVDSALGDRQTADLALSWTEGGPVVLSRAQLVAGPSSFDGSAQMVGAEGKFRITGKGQVTAGDLSRFSGLYGQPLAGAAKAAVDGWYEPLGGAYDGTVDAALSGLAAGEGVAARLLNGDSTMTGRVIRDLNGTRAEGLQIVTPRLKATVDGGLTEAAGALKFDLGLTDMADLAAELKGPGLVSGTLTRSGDQLKLDVTGEGGPGLTVKITGDAAADFATASVEMTAGVKDLAALVPALPGPAQVTGHVTRGAAGFDYDLKATAEPGLSATVKGTAANDFASAQAQVAAGLADLGRFVPELPGAVSAQGTVALAGNAVTVDLAGTAPGGAQFRLAGDLAADGSDSDLHLTGGAPVAIAKPWLKDIEASGQLAVDVLVKGPPGLDAVSGGLYGSDLSVTVPQAGIALSDGAARVLIDPEGRQEAKALLAADVTLSALVAAPGQSWPAVLIGPVQVVSKVILVSPDEIRAQGLTVTNGDAGIDGMVTVTELTSSPKVLAQGLATLGSLGRLRPLTGMAASGSLSAQFDATVDAAAGTVAAKVSGNTTAVNLGGGPAFAAVNGDGSFAAEISQGPEGLRIHSASAKTPALSLEVTGDDKGALAVAAALDSLGRLVPELPGPVKASGTVIPEGAGAKLDLSLTGPAGIRATVKGSVSAATSDLAVSGAAPLGVANAFLPPTVDVQGNTRFDLTMKGVPGLGALAGTVSLADGRVALPAQSFALQGMSGDVRLANGTAQLQIGGKGTRGGSVRVEGSAGLSGAYPLDLNIALSRLRVAMPPTLTTILDGELKLTGPATGGGKLAGRIGLDSTEVRLAFGVSGGTLADVAVVGAPAPVKVTRERAGLGQTAAESGGGSSSSASMALDVVVDSPNEIFVRGRGLDAELGGRIRVTGTTDNLIPIGSFDLIRGRLDIVGRRLNLTVGQIVLQGSTDPTLHLVATTTADEVSVQVAIDGTASDPKVSFSSSPSLPDDEILALLVFGKSIDKISPFQALQLANSVRTLMGGSGEGLAGGLRKQFGLDEFDVSTDATGNTAVRAGKYISDNAYADVVVNDAGEAELEINLDISKHLTAKGSFGSDGGSALGLFFEKDY